MRIGYALLLALLLPGSVLAQGTIRGRVVDAETQDPIPGANVVVRELIRGAATDIDGNYTIERVPAGTYTLEASFVGYRTETRRVTVEEGATITVDFALFQTALNLQEVVVTGAGGPVEVKRLGNTIATINAARLEIAPVQNLSEMLMAREPSVAVLPSGGITGEGARIRIRGSASLSQSNEPIVYIDGIRVNRDGGFGSGFVGTGGGGSPSRLDDLDPEAIERIEILKGAAAATLYGTEASNGVIQIFTKRGAVGPPRFSFRIEQGASWYPKIYPDNTGWAWNQAVADTMSKYFGRPIRPYELVRANFMHEMFETGYHQAYSASVSGGTPGVTYFVNLRWSDEDGPFGAKDGRWYPPGVRTRSADINRLAQASATVNIFPSDKLRLGISTGLTRRHYETPNNNNNIYAAFTLAQFSKPELVRYNNQTGSPAFMTVNEGLQQSYTQDVDRFFGSLNLNYRPSRPLMVDATFGIDVVNQLSREVFPFRWNIDNFSGYNPEGVRRIDDLNSLDITADIKATHRVQLSSSLESTFILGTQGFITRRIDESAEGRRFPGPGIDVTGGAAEQEVFESYLEVVNLGIFAQEQIGFNDYLFLTVGGRLDANSAFGSEFDAVFYPKASLSFIPSDAPFWRPLGPISSLRLRAAVGQSGLQPGAFDALTTYVPVASSSGPGIVPGNLGNPELKPEISTEWEVGMELGLLQDRLALQATYWDRTVTDALVDKQFPVTGGFRASQLTNIGELKGRGIELGFQGTIYSSEQFSVDLFAGASYLWEQVTDMGGAPPIKVGGSYPRYRNFIIEGYAPGAHFGAKLLPTDANHLPIDFNGDGQPDSRDEVLAYLATLTPEDLINPSNGRVNMPSSLGLVLLADEDGDGDLLDHYLGKPTPDWQGSFGATIRFLRNFRLYTAFEFKAGNYYVNNLTFAFRQANAVIGRNLPWSAEVVRDYATGGVDANGNPMNDPQVRLRALERWLNEVLALAPFSGLNTIKPADFLRWRELSLTYDVPRSQLQRLWGIDRLSFTLGVRNLALWTRYDGPDPEVNAVGRGSGSQLDQNYLDGVDAFGFVMPRRVTFTVRFGF
ncbi:SusC/RagA family TonB-linked outer membrane protein [Rhodothermus marinus]|uniref:TonB-dependent receptor plug n=1 Tax=Rhodothermus marinus (strain ATCC 43812 / DSM 4252 / R-10) TaxID=518766 RepID=D0MH24_RHOM4|nr:SusC/RagA family TonB-linked outer membrane protein [Rhodothermus marinus]ACY47809.1 TonB-dependent receptor plug [Rhodothermus marinus DSM 4252]